MKRTATTIREVSQCSGVSTATVSRVINRVGNVSEETVKKVERAIEELSYQRNPLASGLKSGHSRVIGVIVPHLDNYFFMQVLDGVEAALVGRDYALMLAATGNVPQKERQAISSMLSFKADGLIVATSLADASEYERICAESCPVVLIDRRIEGAAVDTVAEENFAASGRLMKLLLDAGHRRIAVFTGNMELHLMRERLDGCRAALRERGLELPEEYLLRCKNSVESGLEAAVDRFSHWRAAGAMPTAITSLNSNVTEGILLAARQSGVEIPGELSLVSFGLLRSKLIVPHVTAIAQDGFRVGNLAGRQLLRRIGEARDAEPAERCDLLLHNEIDMGDSIRDIRSG